MAREAFTLLREGGRMVGFGLPSGEWAGIPEEAAQVRQVELFQPKSTPGEMMDAADAHAAIESRATTGKTLLEVSGAW